MKYFLQEMSADKTVGLLFLMQACPSILAQSLWEHVVGEKAAHSDTELGRLKIITDSERCFNWRSTPKLVCCDLPTVGSTGLGGDADAGFMGHW